MQLQFTIKWPKARKTNNMITEVITNPKPSSTLTEKELFGQFLKLRIQSRTNYGTLDQDYTPEDALRDTCQYDNLYEFSDSLTDALENSEDPIDFLERAIEDFEEYLITLRRVLSDFNGIKSKFFAFPKEPDKADSEAHAAWAIAANAAENDPRYYSISNADDDQDEVEFMEVGSTPAPLSNLEFVELTQEDESSIKGDTNERA